MNTSRPGRSDSFSIALVIITYRRPDELKATAQKLAMQSQVPDLLIVVDNDNSANRTQVEEILRLRGDRPLLKWISEPNNIGPAGGLWVGMRTAVEAGATIILTSDDDDFPASPVAIERTVDALRAARELDSSVVGVGSAGARLTHLGFLKSSFGAATALRVDYLAGSFLPAYFASQEVLESVAPSLWFGYEELHLGVSLRNRNMKLIADDLLREELGLVRKFRPRDELQPWREYCTARNFVRVLSVARVPALVSAIHVLRLLLMALLRVLRHPTNSALRRHLHSRAVGVVDALAGITGPPSRGLSLTVSAAALAGRTLSLAGPRYCNPTATPTAALSDGRWVTVGEDVVWSPATTLRQWIGLFSIANHLRACDASSCSAQGQTPTGSLVVLAGNACVFPHLMLQRFRRLLSISRDSAAHHVQSLSGIYNAVESGSWNIVNLPQGMCCLTPTLSELDPVDWPVVVVASSCTGRDTCVACPQAGVTSTSLEPGWPGPDFQRMPAHESDTGRCFLACGVVNPTGTAQNDDEYRNCRPPVRVLTVSDVSLMRILSAAFGACPRRLLLLEKPEEAGTRCR